MLRRGRVFDCALLVACVAALGHVVTMQELRGCVLVPGQGLCLHGVVWRLCGRTSSHGGYVAVSSSPQRFCATLSRRGVCPHLLYEWREKLMHILC